MRAGHQRQWAEILNNARDIDLDGLTLDVEPDDRIGSTLPNRSKARLRRMLVSVILAAGITWTVASDPERAQVWLASAKSFLETVVSNAREIAERADRERAALHPDMSNASAQTAESIAPLAPIEQATTSTQDEKGSPGAGENLATGSIGTVYADTPEPAAEAQDRKSQEGARDCSRSQPRIAKCPSVATKRSRPEECWICHKNGTRQDPGRCLFCLAAKAVARASPLRSALRSGCVSRMPQILCHGHEGPLVLDVGRSGEMRRRHPSLRLIGPSTNSQTAGAHVAPFELFHAFTRRGNLKLGWWTSAQGH